MWKVSLLTAKLNAISENFLLWVCVHNKVSVIHKFYRRKIRFVGTFYVSFSNELHASKRLNHFRAMNNRKWWRFLRLTVVKEPHQRHHN